jgi:hypothetical protein
MARRSKKPDSKKAVIISVSLPTELRDHFYNHLSDRQTTSSVIQHLIKQYINEKEGSQSKFFDPLCLWYCDMCECYFEVKKSSLMKSWIDKKFRNWCFKSKICHSKEVILIGIDGEDFFDVEEYKKEHDIL